MASVQSPRVCLHSDCDGRTSQERERRQGGATCLRAGLGNTGKKEVSGIKTKREDCLQLEISDAPEAFPIGQGVGVAVPNKMLAIVREDSYEKIREIKAQARYGVKWYEVEYY